MDHSVRAQLDQLGAFIRDFAPVLWAYYSALLEQGFDKSQALTITLGYQRAMFNLSRPNDASQD